MMMTLSDTYERKINYLRIAVTDRCNLRCVYCMPEGGTHILPREDILTYEELLTITRIVTKIGISKVRITGGEPLIRKGLVEFIYQLSRLPGVEDLSITTNGTLLYKYAEKLYEAGIKRINISLDSLNADRYREITRGGNFADVRRGIEVANEIGFDPLKINTVIIKGVNDDEIKDFALLAVKERFSVRFIEFMPVGEDTYWHEENFVPTYKIKEEIESVARLIPLERTSSSESARIYKPENGYGTIGFISPLTKHFCQYCNRIRLTPDGRIRTCLFSDDEIDVKPILRNGGGEVEIIDFFEHAIKRKPKRHYVFDSRVKKCIRFMNSIGG